MDKEEKKKYHREWYLNNKDRHKESNSKWAANNQDKIKESKRKWHEKNKEKVRAYGREWMRGRSFFVYGITNADFENMVKKQDGVCAICGLPPNGNPKTKEKRLHVDHDHITGKVRGLLCFKCNSALGNFNDARDLVASALDYLNGR